MEFQKVEDLTREQIEDLWAMYQEEWWTRGRRLEDVRGMLDHSDLVIAFTDPQSGELAAFARVLTDFVYKALILDIIVKSSYRGRGLGSALLEAVVKHPALEPVAHLELYCLPEMIAFYQRWGFQETADRVSLLRLER